MICYNGHHLQSVRQVAHRLSGRHAMIRGGDKIGILSLAVRNTLRLLVSDRAYGLFVVRMSRWAFNANRYALNNCTGSFQIRAGACCFAINCLCWEVGGYRSTGIYHHQKPFSKQSIHPGGQQLLCLYGGSSRRPLETCQPYTAPISRLNAEIEAPVVRLRLAEIT